MQVLSGFYLLQMVYGAKFLDFYAEEAKSIYGDIIRSTLSDWCFFILKEVISCLYAVLNLVCCRAHHDS
jgi:hypothetical protein